MERALLDELTIEEWIKSAQLRAVRVAASCEEALVVVDKTVDELIQKFQERSPSKCQIDQLLKLNQEHGNAAVALVKIRVLLARSLEEENVWVSGTRGQRRKLIREMRQANRKLKLVAKRIEKAQRRCNELEEAVN